MPKSLNVLVVVSDIRIVHIHPITDSLSKCNPLLGIFHNLLTAGIVIFVYCNLLSDILFSNAQHLLNAKLNRKTMCVPTGLSLYKISALSLETAECVLDSSGHHVVDTRHTVCRRRSLKEYEFLGTLSCLKAIFKALFCFPFLKNTAVNLY